MAETLFYGWKNNRLRSLQRVANLVETMHEQSHKIFESLTVTDLQLLDRGDFRLEYYTLTSLLSYYYNSPITGKRQHIKRHHTIEPIRVWRWFVKLDKDNTIEFGLCEYPKTITVSGIDKEVKTGRSRWSWSDFCNVTDVAQTDPQLMVERYKQIAQFFDFISNETPLSVIIEDETNFYVERDEAKLLELGGHVKQYHDENVRR